MTYLARTTSNTHTSGLAALVVEIARHELRVMLRTRRALAVMGLYLATALVAGLAYVFTVRLIERQALTALESSGIPPSQAAKALGLAGERAYGELIAAVAGVAASSIDPSIRDSIVLPALLWGSLALLPLAIVLTTFDQIAADLASRSMVYTLLRAPRHAVLFGKVAAHMLLFTLLTIAASLTMVSIAGSLLQSFAYAEALVGLARVTALLVPFGFCYICLTALASSTVRQPVLALFYALGLMLLLRVANWFEYVPSTSTFGALRWMSYISPAHYHGGLWQAGILAPITSVAAYVGLGIAFLVLALKRLRERDL